MHLVGSHFYFCRICQYDLCAVETLVHLVDDGVVEHTGLRVFLHHIEVKIAHVVEHPFGDFHGRLCNFDGNKECAELLLGVRGDFVLKIEDERRERDNEQEDGAHHSHQGHTSCLHREELEVLSHVTKGDEGSQQYGKWQRGGNKIHRNVPEELPEHVHSQALAHKVIDVAPQELHDKHEEADEECAYKEL